MLLAIRHVTEGASEDVRYSIKKEEEEFFRDEKFAYFFFCKFVLSVIYGEEVYFLLKIFENFRTVSFIYLLFNCVYKKVKKKRNENYENLRRSTMIVQVEMKL